MLSVRTPACSTCGSVRPWPTWASVKPIREAKASRVPCEHALCPYETKAISDQMRERLKRVRVVDSHTGGEPTRIIVSGGPSLPAGNMARLLEEFRSRHDHLRHALVNEPRGSEVIVGALLCEPANPGSAAGVLYFNNVGYLGMCVHGTIGLVVTLS